MKYIIKVNDSYVSNDGSLVSSQRDAMRIESDSDAAPRIVKMRPHGSAPSTANDSADVPLGDVPSADASSMRLQSRTVVTTEHYQD